MGKTSHDSELTTAIADLVSARGSHLVEEVLGQFWLPPHEMSSRLTEVIALSGEVPRKVLVSGETRNVTLYVVYRRGVLVGMPFSPLADNPLLKELYSADNLLNTPGWQLFPPHRRLLRRLALPRVLLINPCVLKNFPIPRLNLSVGLLAGYLRKRQLADVRIVDMQMGITSENVVREVLRERPALLGMSVSYGQKQLAIEILDAVYQAKNRHQIAPLVAVGNIIAASSPAEFTRRYPDIIVALGEGETTIAELIGYVRGNRPLEQVPGIAFVNGGQLVSTANAPVVLDDVPLPALDTLDDLSRQRGAVTLELSRGCQWNVCTFCPREHKSHHWKTMNIPQILQQIEDLCVACEHFKIAKHVFLADEEFIGGQNDGQETRRISEIARGLIRIRDQFDLSFDAAARVDQVFDPHMDKRWHVQRLEMWHRCRQAGLDRLFMGIESGSNRQLQRFGKGVKAEHSILAIRLLSALGIPLRFGFITFDQLMIGFSDLHENIAFLERTDAFMRPVDVTKYGYDTLFDLLVNDDSFVAAQAAGKPVYAGVSYMLATMEVLINSRYAAMLRNAEKRYGKQLILDALTPDTNMGRYRVDFVDDTIRDISISCQRWIDRQFGVAYSVKSLYKVAPADERAHLMSWMIAHRQISLLLLKALVYLFDTADGAPPLFDEAHDAYQDGNVGATVGRLKADAALGSTSDRLQIIEECMNALDKLIGQENRTLTHLLTVGAIRDAEGDALMKAIRRWDDNVGVWRLINDPGAS